MNLPVQVLAIILLSTSMVLSEEDLTRQEGHGGAHDISNRDDCSNVLKPHGKHYKLRTLNFPGVNWTCCTANPGFKIVGPCEQGKPNTTQVETCKEGTYISEFAHIRKKCDVDDLVCSDPFIKIPSNITQAPVCVCQDGFFHDKNNKCSPYSKCKPGFGVAIHGNTYRDTKCKQCKRGFVSTTWSSSDRCLLNSSLLAYKNFISKKYPESTNPTTPVSSTIFAETPNFSSQVSNPTSISEKNGTEKDCDPAAKSTFAAVVEHPISSHFLTFVGSCILWFCLIKFVPNFSKCIKNISLCCCLRYIQRFFSSSEGSYSLPSDSKTDLSRVVDVQYDNRTPGIQEQSVVDCTGLDEIEEKNSAVENHPLLDHPKIQASLVRITPAISNLSLADKDEEIAKKMIEFKMFLAEEVDLEETKDLYRRYWVKSNPETFLDDCELYRKSTKQTFHSVWKRLEKRGVEEFNPNTVLNFFVSKDNNLLAEKIRHNFSDLLQEVNCI